MNFYQKCIIIFLLSLTVIFFSINIFFSNLKNNVSSILNSDQFNYYLEIKINDILENLAEGELSKEKEEYYKYLIKKIRDKYQNVF